MRFAPRSLAVLVAAAMLLASPAAAHAGDTYLALKGGVWAPTAKDGFSAASGIVSGQFPASGDVELAYGATMGILGLQIAGGYMWSTLDVSGGGTVKTNGVPLYAVAQLRLPIFFIQPYLEAGLGAFVNFADSSAGSATKVSFMGVGGAGVDFVLGPILLGVEARYNYITEQAFDWGSLRLSGVNVTANVGYVF